MNNTFLETIKVVDGEIFNLSFHQKRYDSVLNSLGISTYKNLHLFLNPPKDGTYRCRLLYTKDKIEVSYHSYTKRSIKTLKLIYDDTIVYDKKYADRTKLDALFAQREEADDILIIKNNLITDTSIANIAFYDGDKWLTPKQPLLKGTTRARLLQLGKIIELDIEVQDLKNYKKIALLNAMIDFDIIATENIKATFC
ncbi:MAG: aminotransferase class IV family protein [Sulfurimonas sp.]